MAPPHRFVDRDAFARFAGIGVGCQHFQATQVLEIQVGPDHMPSGGGSGGLEADESEDNSGGEEG